jgi:biopolymer transport protein ExbB
MDIVTRIKNLMLDTGAAWVMWLLIGLSVVSLSIVLERALVLYRASGNAAALRATLARDLAGGSIERALASLRGSLHPAAHVATRGMQRALETRDAKQIEKAMAAEQMAQRAKLEKNLSFLGTLGNNAPFVGLFGTVIGIVEAFEYLGSSSEGLSGQGGNQLVMAAIAEALVSTAVGIAVAIPAVFAFNQLLRSIKVRLDASQMIAEEVLASLPLASLPVAGPEEDAS